MENKIKTQIRQTNIQILNELTEEQKFEFQKALEKKNLKLKMKKFRNYQNSRNYEKETKG